MSDSKARTALTPDELASKEWHLGDESAAVGFDELVALAARICEAPISVINVFDGVRYETKAAFGIPGNVTDPFCAQLLGEGEEVCQIEDLTKDARFAEIPSALELPDVRFYAGAPMMGESGRLIGSICVMDTKPRLLDEHQVKHLQTLSKQVVIQIELRQQNFELRNLQRTIEANLEALRSSEERFRLAMKGYPGGLWDLDVATSEMVYSPGFCLLLSPRECRAPRNLEESFAYVHPDDRPLLKRAFAEHFKDISKDFDVEYRMRSAGQDYRWFVSHGQAVLNGAGEAERMVGFTRDITNRKRIARAISRSESDLREAQRIAKMGSWRIEVETNAVTWSDQLFSIFRLDPRNGAPALEEQARIFSPESWELLNTHMNRAVEVGEPYVLELEAVYPNGETGWVLTRGEPVTDTQGKIVALQGTAQDITNRKTIEETLREQAVLIDQAPDGFIVRDLDHEVQFWSEGAERIYGISPDEAVGVKISDLLAFDPEKFAAADRQVREHGEWRGEFKIPHLEGDDLIVEARWKLLYDNEGAPKSILSVHTDLTERKKIENQFLRAQRMESIGTLAGGIAHDLNNVLSPVLMGMAVLRRLDPNSRAERIIDNVERSAKRGADLVKQVLSFARGVEGTRAPIRLSQITAEIESIVHNSFPKSIEFRVRSPKDLWLVVGDATQINQVFLNLCVNARDAMPKGGSLRIDASNIEVDEQYASMNDDILPGRYVVLEVSDTGCGIPQEIIDRVFEPFFTTKDVANGTGLGLSTVVGIVRSHGGIINVYSEIGKGTTFKIYLPAADGDDANQEKSAEDDELLHGQGETVLLVDDEAPVLNVTQHTLEAFGYTVLSAEDGAQAISEFALHRDDIAVVITDMMMPVMDGPALIAAIQRIDPEIPIVAASGLSSGGSDGINRVSALGVKHFLSKPYSADSLLRTLREILDRPASN